MRFNRFIKNRLGKVVMVAAILLANACFVKAAFISPPLNLGKTDTSQISLPEHTIEGWLDNGLHYLILPNDVPAHTVEMRLVMRLGAVQETEQQKGCAHFLEHMAFAGTAHFPERTMIDYLEGLGMKFGRDINAVTGYDRTIFMLTVPMVKSDLGILDSCLLVLKDWLTAVDFKADRVRKERGVILEELRTYQNDDVFYDLKIGNSRFKDRMPLGSAEDIRRVKRSRLIDFYKKWYTPQLASVVVVGDVDPVAAEHRIRRLFADIPSKQVDGYQIYPLTYDKETELMEVRDSIKQKSVLEMMLPHATIVGRDIPTTIQKEKARLLAYALDRRFSARRFSCSVSDEWYLSNSHHFVLSLSDKSKEGFLEKVKRVSGELHHLQQEGWLPEEWLKIKTDFVEAMTLDEEGRASAFYCDDFTDYILQGDRYLHDQDELKRIKKALHQTDMESMKRQLGDLLQHFESQVLLAYRNNAGQEQTLSKEEVLAAWEEGKEMEVPDFVFYQADRSQPSIPTPTCLRAVHFASEEQVDSEIYLPTTKMTLVTLKNGIKLVFRPTAEGERTILLNLMGKGGLAHLSPELYHRYESTAGFMEMGGIEQVPYDTLCAYMAQTGLLLNISISAYWHDLLGTAPADRSQELFNLIDEKLHRPELCYADFEEVRQDELEDFGEETVLDQVMQRATDRLLVNRMDSLVGNSPSTWFAAKQRSDVESMNLDSMAAYFRGLYGQLPGTTIVIVGNYELDQVKQQAIATFGRMQKQPCCQEWLTAPPHFTLPGQKYVEGFENSNDTQTVLEYVYPGNFVPSLQEGMMLKLMRDLLQDRLLRELREKENIVYSPYALLYYYGEPQNSYYFNLSLSVDTENTARVDKLLKRIIADLQDEVVTEGELDKLKRGFLVNKQQTLTESAAVNWRNILSTLVKNGETLEDFEDYEEQLRGITPEMIRQAFRRYICQDKAILLYLGKHQLYD